jgi:hypothetical protein
LLWLLSLHFYMGVLCWRLGRPEPGVLFCPRRGARGVGPDPECRECEEPVARGSRGEAKRRRCTNFWCLSMDAAGAGWTGIQFWMGDRIGILRRDCRRGLLLRRRWQMQDLHALFWWKIDAPVVSLEST